LDQPPSLFDDYRIQEGLAVFDLKFDEAMAQEGGQDGSAASAECHAFSNDDCLLAFGMHNGSILIYETSSGRRRWTLHRRHCCPIADMAFLSNVENRLLCVDEEGRCSEWDLDDEPKCVNDVDYVRKLSDLDWVSAESLLPHLSANGKFLAIPLLDRSRASLSRSEWKIPSTTDCTSHIRLRNRSSVPDSKHYLHVHIFALANADQKPGGQSSSSLPALSVQMNRENACFHSISDVVQLSPLSTSLLLTACDLVDVYLVLWPRMSDPDMSFKLKGNKATFSADDEYLVAWTDPELSDGKRSDTVYIWRMHQLASTTPTSSPRGWDHPRLPATDAVVLQEPGFGSVLACAFVRLAKGPGIAVCYASDEIQIVVWSVHAQTAVHVIHAGLTSSIGAFDFSVSRDAKWISLQSHAEQQIRAWSSEKGVEVIRIHPPSSGDPTYPLDLHFSKTSKYLLTTEARGASLWIPTPLHPYNTSDRPFQHLTSLSDAELANSQVVCKFSLDGESIGFLNAPSTTVDVWNLASRDHVTLDWKGILQAVETENGTMSMDREYEFYQFALSHDGSSVVTCMADNTVLFWEIAGSVTCKAVDREASDCFPVQDLCFSVDPEGETVIVLCQDQGDLIWLDPHHSEMIGAASAGGDRLCKFTADGKTAILMADTLSVHVWDLVHRVQLHHFVYQIPLVSPFRMRAEVGISPDGSFYVAGFDSCQKPVCFLPHGVQSLECAGRIVSRVLCVSDDGQYALTLKPTEGEVSNQPQISDSVQSLTPPARRRKKPLMIASKRGSIAPERALARDLCLVHISGKHSLKRMRLPCDMHPESWVVFSADGRRGASLTAANDLVVWNAHMVEETVIQERLSLAEIIRRHASMPSDLDKMLNDHGPSLLNHPYEHGMTLVACCVYHQNADVLTHLLGWALKNECKLELEGTIHVPDSHITFDNVVDLALFVNSSEIAKILFDRIIDGVTTDDAAAHIFERSLMTAAALYPSLFTELIDNPKLLKTICPVHVSQSCFQDGQPFVTSTDSHLLPSSDHAASVWKALEKKELERTPDQSGIQIAADAAVIPIPHVAKISLGSCLHRLNLIPVHHSVYNSEFVRALIDVKYKLFAKSFLQEDFFHHMSLLICFTLLSIFLVNPQDSQVSTATATLAGLSAAFACVQFVYFMRIINKLLLHEGMTGLRFLTVQCMVWKNFCAFLLIMIVIPWYLYSDPGSQFLGPAVGFANFFLWMRLVQYAETCETVGPLLVTLQEVIGDITSFLFLLVISVIASGLSLYFLIAVSTPVASSEDLVEHQEHELHAGTVWKGSLMTLMLMLGDVGNVFDSIMKKEQGFRLYAALGLMIFYLALVAVVLLNVMIAMMGDSFDRVKNSERSLFNRRKARVIHLLELGLSGSKREQINSKIGAYLHVLRPQSQSHLRNDLWTGRLNEIQMRTRDEIKNMQRVFTKDVRNVEDRLQRIEHSLSRKTNSDSAY